MAARYLKMREWWFGISLIAVLIACGTGEAHAQGSINLAWDDCSAGLSVANKNFACNTNTGAPFTLIGSFVPPAGVNEFLGATAIISLQFAGGVPDWWKHGSGQCRGTSGLSTSSDFTGGPFSCIDFAAGQAVGAFSYEVGFGCPRLRVEYAVPFDLRGPLTEDEYYAFKVNLLRSKTTGTGSCAGCNTPATLTLDQIQLFQPFAVGFDPVLTTPLVSSAAHWQGGASAQMINLVVDATDATDQFSISGGPCLAAGQVHNLQLCIGPHSIAPCGNFCGTGAPPMQFNLSPAGIVTYDPILEGPLGGDGTNTLVVNSFTFPGPGDDVETSMGLFRIVVEPDFWALMMGYPGYDVLNGVHRLVSPGLFDPTTLIGRSTVHRHDPTNPGPDRDGTPVGTAGTVISDASFTVVPPDFQGPDNTLEIHTEIRSLNLTGGGVAVRAGIQAPGHPISAISPGEIEAGLGTQGLFPAESFFDVNVEVDLPVLGTLYNTTSLLVENSGITCFPPRVVYIHRHTGPVPVAFKNTDTEMPPRWMAGQRFGWLVLAGHGFDFDMLAAVKAGEPQLLGDPFAELRAIVDAEPEMSDTATAVVDLEDVLTFAPGGVFVSPGNRDDLLDGIHQAAALGQSGDPCAGTVLLIDLYQRVDGHANPDDWVNDADLRAVLRERIQTLGAHLQAQANQGGGCLPTDVTPTVAPARMAILGIQPNPSAGEATIHYAIPRPGRVTMAIYDLSGRLVQKLVDAEIAAGTHRAVWDGRADRVGGPAVSSGTYFVRLNMAGVVQVKRMVILR